MNKNVKTLNISIILILTFTILTSEQQCNKKGGIGTIKCADIESETTDYGNIYVSNYDLGSIKFIGLANNGECSIQNLGTNLPHEVVLNNTQIGRTGSSIALSLKKELDISLQGSYAGNTTIKADLQSKLKSKADFNIYNYKVHTLSNEITLLNQDQGVKSAIKSLSDKYGSKIMFFTINEVTDGDSLIFNIDKDKSGSANVSLTSLSINFSINYDCSAGVGIRGNNSTTTLLYQILFIEWDPVNNKIIPSTKTMDIHSCKTFSLN